MLKEDVPRVLRSVISDMDESVSTEYIKQKLEAVVDLLEEFSNRKGMIK